MAAPVRTAPVLAKERTNHATTQQDGPGGTHPEQPRLSHMLVLPVDEPRGSMHHLGSAHHANRPAARRHPSLHMRTEPKHAAPHVEKFQMHLHPSRAQPYPNPIRTSAPNPMTDHRSKAEAMGYVTR